LSSATNLAAEAESSPTPLCKSVLRKLAMAPKLQEEEYLIFPGNRNKFTNTRKETPQ
jgi:hypothetical protein